MKKVFTLLSCLLSMTCYGQREAQNWFFGNGGGLSFAGSSPTTLTVGQLNSYEACSAISDTNGNLLFYTNSEAIWDRNHSVMPGSTSLAGHTSTTQGALIVRDPNNASRYYLLNVDACDNQLIGGLRYSIVDMTLRNGQGGLVLPLNLTIPTPSSSGKLTEKLTAIRHANGRDTWVLVHEWLGNGFFAFLISPAGIAGSPVVSRLGSIHQGGGGTFGNANAVGFMKASPNGSLLGVAVRDAGLELFDFNNGTGQVTNARRLYTGNIFDRTYGVEFSPDNTKLYTTDLANRIDQYNLNSPTPASTRQTIGSSFGLPTSALQLGPDGRIYVSLHQSSYIAAIANPNASGAACNYVSSFVDVGGVCQVGLPNFPNSFPQQSASAVATISASSVCLGTPTSFSVAVTPLTSNATFAWNFGEPTSGPANSGTGMAPTHIYSSPGTYITTVTVALPGLMPITTTTTVIVNPLPLINLGPTVQQLCQGQTLTLNAGPQLNGSTYRWQDGSTNSSLVVTQSGIYTVTVTSPQGCSTQATTTVTALPVPIVNLGPAFQQICQGQTLTLTAGVHPAGSTYRWQNGSTNNTLTVTQSGTYSVTVTSPQGCSTQAATTVVVNSLPVVGLGSSIHQLCQGQTLRLTGGAQPNGSTYRWQDASTGDSFTVTQPGTYSLTVTSPQGCSAQATTTVISQPTPSVRLGADTTVCLENPLVLRVNPQPIGATYRWQDGSTSNIFMVQSPGSYAVDVFLAGGCVGRDEIVVREAQCPFMIPNIITPNGDAKNDFFVLKGLNPKNWRIEIYNRWGNQVYETSSYDNKWDAINQSDGVYYYMLTHNTTGQQYKGYVEVSR